MAHETISLFQNDAGVREIVIGVHKFMCCGASAPHDHPHVFLDMGSDNEIICPYCSTLFKFNAQVAHDASDPSGCVINQSAS